jgi:S-adenosylmethionine-diacylglycerol 3-amino-3-carboxypropyl transferase
VRFLARRRAALFGLGIPPAQYDKLAADGGGDVLPVLRERVRKLMCDFPVAENYFAWQAFARRYDDRPGASLPPYLAAGALRGPARPCPGPRVLNRSLTEVLAEAPAASRTPSCCSTPRTG